VLVKPSWLSDANTTTINLRFRLSIRYCTLRLWSNHIPDGGYSGIPDTFLKYDSGGNGDNLASILQFRLTVINSPYGLPIMI